MHQELNELRPAPRALPPRWPEFLQLENVVSDSSKLAKKKRGSSRSYHDVCEVLIDRALSQLNCTCSSKFVEQTSEGSFAKVSTESIGYKSLVSSGMREFLPFEKTILNVAIARHCLRQGVADEVVKERFQRGKTELLGLKAAHLPASNAELPWEFCNICDTKAKREQHAANEQASHTPTDNPAAGEGLYEQEWTQEWLPSHGVDSDPFAPYHEKEQASHTPTDNPAVGEGLYEQEWTQEWPP